EKLKEHPIPESLKQKIIKENDPALKLKEISGTISVADDYANSIPKNAKLFVIARYKGVDSGPPLAVQRHNLVEFPFTYRIGPTHVMLEGNKFEGEISIKARIDQDGNAKSSPGDIEGRRMAKAGEENVDIILDQMIAPAKKSADGADSVSGVIKIDPEMEKNLPDNWKLFLFARQAGVQRGPPLAVKLLESIEFPYAFSLGQESVMMPGSVFEGEMTLTARIDQDGDAKSSPDDLEGILKVTAGDHKVELVIDHKVGTR
ncbi:hypothetical protein MNBD_NITROSPINAE05-1246, partial [hydrothermal vent metagenome]